MSSEYIQFKNGNAYFRRKVPADVRAVIGLREWCQALRTGDKHVARQRADKLKVETDQAIARAHRLLSGDALTSEELGNAAQVYFERERHLGSMELKQAKALAGWMPGEPGPRTNGSAVASLADLANGLGGPPDIAHEEQARKAQLRSLEDCLRRGDHRLVHPFADEVFLQRGLALETDGVVEIDRDRQDYETLCRELLVRQITAIKEGLVELWKASLGVKDAAPRKLIVPVRRDEEAADLREEAAQRPLELFDRFARDSEGKRGRSMLTTVETALRLLEEVTGEKAVAEITARDIAVFHDVVSECPAKHRALLKTRTMKEAINKNKARPSPFPANKRGTVHKHISALKSFFRWASERHFAASNPAAGLSIEGCRSSGDQRESFTAEELQALFSTRTFHTAPPHRDHRFWVPYFALYTGARLAEICQLDVADVHEKDGMVWIEITNRGKGKSVKSAAGRRIVPLHDHLLCLGFLAYWRARKEAGDTKLFPRAPRGGEGRNPYNPVSQWFTRLLRQAGIRRTGLSFHSFRHGWNEAARQSAIPKDMREALMGHANGTVNDEYGGTFGLQARAEAIKKLRFPTAEVCVSSSSAA